MISNVIIPSRFNFSSSICTTGGAGTGGGSTVLSTGGGGTPHDGTEMNCKII